MTALKHTVVVLTLVGAMATAKPVQNPPPARVLAGSASDELAPLEVPAEYAKKVAYRHALDVVRDTIDATFAPLVVRWKDPAAREALAPTLVISPHITKTNFKPATRQVTWQPSYIVLTIKCIEKPRGTGSAEPTFVQRTSAMAGASTAGAARRKMPVRVVAAAASYPEGNYAQAVGGPTWR